MPPQPVGVAGMKQPCPNSIAYFHYFVKHYFPDPVLACFQTYVEGHFSVVLEQNMPFQLCLLQCSTTSRKPYPRVYPR